MSPEKIDSTVVKMKKLEELANELGYTQSQLAIAWTLASSDVSTCLLGFTKLEQVEENVKALELYKKWNSDIEKKCEDILANSPEPDLDWRTWTPLPSRRS